MADSIRERIVLEVIRRAETGIFSTVQWASVVREELPDGYDASQGALLAVLEGREDHNPGANTRNMHRVTLFLSFVVPLAQGEAAQAVANNVSAEVIGWLSSDQTMEEGGPGTGGAKLATGFQPIATDPDLIHTNADCAAATIEFVFDYRSRSNDLFAV